MTRRMGALPAGLLSGRGAGTHPWAGSSGEEDGSERLGSDVEGSEGSPVPLTRQQIKRSLRGRADPTSADPSKEGCSSADPSSVDPSSADPSSTVPVRADLSSADPSSADPIRVDPQVANPFDTEPNTADTFERLVTSAAMAAAAASMAARAEVSAGRGRPRTATRQAASASDRSYRTSGMTSGSGQGGRPYAGKAWH